MSFFPSTFLSHIKQFFLFVFFKPGTDNYTINNSV